VGRRPAVVTVQQHVDVACVEVGVGRLSGNRFHVFAFVRAVREALERHSWDRGKIPRTYL
jgi:hypothetical protein